MKFSQNANTAEQITAECLLIGIMEEEALSGTAQRIDQASGGLLSRLIERGDISAKAKSTTTLHDVAGVSAPRLIITGFGKQTDLSSARYHEICLVAGKKLRGSPALSG